MGAGVVPKLDPHASPGAVQVIKGKHWQQILQLVQFAGVIVVQGQAGPDGSLLKQLSNKTSGHRSELLKSTHCWNVFPPSVVFLKDKLN